MAYKQILSIFNSTKGVDEDEIVENYLPLTTGGIVREYQVAASGSPNLVETFSMRHDEIPRGLILTNAQKHGFHVYDGDVVEKYAPAESEFLTGVARCTLPGKIEAAAMSADPRVSHAITGKKIYRFDDREPEPKACSKAQTYNPVGAMTTRGDASVVACDDEFLRTFKKHGFEKADPHSGNLIHPMLPLSRAKVSFILFPENSAIRNLAVVVVQTPSKVVVYAAALDVAAKKGDASQPWCNLKILDEPIEDYASADLSKIVKYYSYNGRYLVTCISYGRMKTLEIIKNVDRLINLPMRLVPVHTSEYVIEPLDYTFLNVRVEETHHLKGDGAPKVLQDMRFVRVPEGKARDEFMRKFMPVGILSTEEHVAGAFNSNDAELCHLGESYSNMFPQSKDLPRR